MIRNILLLVALLGVSSACTCLPRTPQENYCASEWVGVFKILKKTAIPNSIKLIYTSYVEEVFRATTGKPQQGTKVKITTMNSSAACGVDWLVVGKSYLLSGDFDKQGMRMNLCGQVQAKEWDSVDPEIKNALEGGCYEPCPC